ncbi:MAG TPA: class I SAM-dependent methyltransferase [Intrasporangium sp.]|nr:class I SAM-dependent methyltransferase [Intrasporangium sp.]
MTDRAAMSRQYGSTANLETRRSVWGPGPEGLTPVEVLLDTVVAASPGRVLEIGCGTGRFARSVIEALPHVDYVATDLSAAMVASAAALGIPAQQAPAEALPFADASFDVVVAAWMLYHVPALDRTLAEVRRVLRPGGLLCAATNGDEHLADLLREAGGAPLVTQFSSENAAPALRRHFEQVTQRDIETRATFEDHAAAAAYLSSFSPTLAATLPAFEGMRQYAGHTSILTAR